ncbi:P68 family surface lipoprotein [Mycoplasma sp. 1654_15]|uniref:P68 family surface lipoprotein n=1 Tax=Mycoplasma sp. 1654_15 TaxID=2725994 RepID=UPI001449133A|nr:P80 family lipoprotein [Mycoplasma sp. 1654_15]QJB71515.1 P80 family lipoprotein [Mycoplasma sp. 1654_15]
MKFKNKISKLLTASAILVPTVFLASCQSTTRFDQVNDKKLVIAHTFKNNESRFLALKEIVDLWNNTENVKNEKVGFDRIELNGQFAPTYAQQGEALEKQLKVKNTNQLINLIFGYPTLAAVASQYNMSLNYSDFPELNQAIETTFPKNFLQESKEIAGLDPSKYWILPTLKSSRSLLINGPLFNYIVEEATKTGTRKATVKEEDKSWFENLDKEKTDSKYIKKVWGDYVPILVENGGLDGYVFSKNALDNYEDFFDLISRIRKSFPTKFTEEENKNKNQKFILGLDDIGNSMYSIAFANADADFKKFLFSLEKNNSPKNDSDTVIKYATFLDEKNSPRYQTGLKTFNQIDKLLKDGSLYFYGLVNGNPPSNLFLNDHHMLFAITTTSNYKQRFATPKEKINILEFKPNPKDPEKLKSELKNSVNVSSVPVFVAFSPTDEETKQNILFKFTSTDNQLEIPEASWWTQSETQQVNYSLNFKSFTVKKTTDNKLLVEEWDANSTQAKTHELQENSDFLNLINSLNSKENEETKGVWSAYFFNKNQDFKGGKLDDFTVFDNLHLSSSTNDKLAWITATKNVKHERVDKDKSLNENEIHFLIEPNKKDKNSAKKLVTFQGPGLIGIHSNNEEDLATANFLKWFITEKITFTYKEKEADTVSKTFEGTPNEYLAFRGNYLAPTNSNLISDINDKTKFPNNRLFKLLFETFKNVKDNPEKYAIFSEPAGALSGRLRTNITIAFQNYSNQIKTNPNATHDYDSYVRNLKNLFLPNKIQ